MATKTVDNTSSLRLQWRALERERALSDFQRALLLRRIRVACGAEGQDFLAFLSDAEVGLGVHPRAALGLARMAEAVDLVGDESVWAGIGWPGMQRLVKIESPAERRAVATAVKKAGTLTPKGFAELLAAKAPSMRRERTGAEVKGDVLQAALHERKILLDALRAIARDYSLIVKHTVSDEVKALLGVEPVAVG